MIKLSILFLVVAIFAPVVRTAQAKDMNPPLFVRLAPISGSVVHQKEVIISGSVDDSSATVTLNDASALGAKTLKSHAGDFAFKLSLHPGLNQFQVTAVGLYGNSSSRTVEIIFSSDATGVDSISSVSSDNVWLHPNGASVDMLDLFTSSSTCSSLPNPDKWKEARATIKVFGFYGGSAATGCTVCGSNTLENLRAYKAFCKLNNWGKKISLADEPITAGDCMGSGAGTKSHINNVQFGTAGAPVTYVDMDEPWRFANDPSTGYPSACGANKTMSLVAGYVKNYISAVKAKYPSVQIGLTEPYPFFSEATIESWVNTLLSNGVTLPFFHLDVDQNAYNPSQYAIDLPKLNTFIQSKGIVFGVILDGKDGQTDCDWDSQARTLASNTKNAIGVPQHSLFMSFANADTNKQPPHNVPECDNFCSLTGLVNEGWWDIMQGLGDNSSFLSQQNVPAQIGRGQTFTVTINMKNTGGSTWTPSVYALRPTTGNGNWGVFQVYVPSNTCVPPQQPSSYATAFTFTCTAPSTPGTYGFQWKMAIKTGSQPPWIPFGASSSLVQIIVN